MTDKHRLIEYRQENHGSPLEEWSPHRHINGWWYATGYLREPGRPDAVYFYQYTCIRAYIMGKEMFAGMLAFADFKNGVHIYENVFGTAPNGVWANECEVVMPNCVLTRDGERFHVEGRGKALQYKLDLAPNKPAVWHGDNGILIMGKPGDKRERSLYWSYTSMSTAGELTYRNNRGVETKLGVEGRSWFDRQWGPFANVRWEWFSLRFFDDEEIMLMAFPREGFKSATYIDSKGGSTVFSDFSYTIDRWLDVSGSKVGIGWEITVPMKERHYTVQPLMDNQVNVHPLGFYWEGLSDIINPDGKLVGYCVTEIVPERASRTK